MHVVYCLTRSDTVGGAHTHILELTHWLRARGAQVHVLVGGRGPFCGVLEREEVPYATVPALTRAIGPSRDARALLQLRRALRRLRPDVVSLHSSKAGLLGRVAGLGLGAPILYTAHGWSFAGGYAGARLYRAAERVAAPLARRIITVSEHDRQQALRAGVGDAQRVVTIRNGVQPPPAVADPSVAPGAVRLGCVARLDRQKDHETLFRALAGLQEQEWTLELIGEGPLEGVLVERARALGIADRIAFTGLRHDVRERLACHQAFVLPSHWEGLPLSVLEAMSAGLPVVASDVGGTGEAVAEGRTGYLVPPGEVATWRARLRRLLQDPDERQRLGEQGRARFHAEFTLERMARATASLYEHLAQRRVRVTGTDHVAH